jgi:phage gpG-like protein
MARKRFATKITHARFVYGPFSSEVMAHLAGGLRDSMRGRIAQGLNANDQPAKELSPGWAKQKVAKGKIPIRNWTMTGNTMRSMVVLSANENRAVIGFNNPVAGRIARFNQRREDAFGVSSHDNQNLMVDVRATMQQVKVVTVRKIA